MTKETEQALRESVAHWERMRDGTTIGFESPHGTYCALCRYFFKDYKGGPCAQCPVKLKTLETHCENTPWKTANEAWIMNGPHSQAFKDAADKMIDFLKSLLPQ